MIEKDKEFFINYPVFLRYKTYFDFCRLKWVSYLKGFNINERIVEIPFAIQCLKDFPSSATILDIGCSESLFPIKAASLGYNMTGIDLRSYPYEHPNFSFFQGDILNLPFQDQSFDAVFSISALEHIGLGAYNDTIVEKDGDKEAIKQIIRVLKKNGTFILTIPYGMPKEHSYRIYDSSRLEGMLKNFDIQVIKYFTQVKKDNRKSYWLQCAQTELMKSGDHGVCLIKALLK